MGEERGWREAIALIRLHVLVEGQTEETFVNQILAPELASLGIFADAHRLTTGRRRGQVHRGGFSNYEHLSNDLLLWMKQDQASESWFTTMVDFFRLPTNFPAMSTLPANLPAHAKIQQLEAALAADIANKLQGLPVSNRFIPYIQLHEFEALLFSDAAAFSEAFPGRPVLIDKIASIRNSFNSPEDINDKPETAPSKRIAALAGDYEKVVAAPLILKRIGLAKVRQECSHFN